MQKNLLPALLALVLLVAACAAPKATLVPIEATIGHPTEVTLYKVAT